MDPRPFPRSIASIEGLTPVAACQGDVLSSTIAPFNLTPCPTRCKSKEAIQLPITGISRRFRPRNPSETRICHILLKTIVTPPWEQTVCFVIPTNLRKVPIDYTRTMAMSLSTLWSVNFLASCRREASIEKSLSNGQHKIKNDLYAFGTRYTIFKAASRARYLVPTANGLWWVLIKSAAC